MKATDVESRRCASICVFEFRDLLLRNGLVILYVPNAVNIKFLKPARKAAA